MNVDGRRWWISSDPQDAAEDGFIGLLCFLIEEAAKSGYWWEHDGWRSGTGVMAEISGVDFSVQSASLTISRLLAYCLDCSELQVPGLDWATKEARVRVVLSIFTKMEKARLIIELRLLRDM
jgi:hypothetical protein